MAGRNRSLLENLAYLSTIVTALVTLGIVGAFAVGFQALLGALWILSPAERILFGMCAFLIALGLVLALTNYVRKRRVSEEANASNGRIYIKRWQDLDREKEDFKTKFQESEQKREELEKELKKARSHANGIGVPTLTAESAWAANERLGKENQQLQEQVEQLKAEMESLKQKRVSTERHTQGEDLKQRCRELAEGLHEFLENYAWDEVARAEAQDADLHYEIAHADTETMREFRKRLRPEVMRMITGLKRRGWWKQKDFDLPDWEAVERLAHPRDLQLVADRLERLGYGP